MKSLIDILELSEQEIMELVNTACDIIDHPAEYAHKCDGRILATLFFEPSTRTRLSFEAAMLNLGGHVLGFPSENVSSATKGESVADTIRVVSCYADIVAMRHPKEGAPLRASRYSRIPVINAGDGGHQHPTQTLTDLMTIRRRMGRLDNLTIGLCGDLKFGRTVHSLLKTMARCKNVRFVLISPEELRVPDYIINDVLEANGIPYKETRSLEESMPELDILYMTRVQKERFFNEEDYIRLKNSYVLTREKMAQAKASGCFAVAMDVDAAGLPFLKNMTPPAGSKSVEELAEIVQLAERPFIVKGVMTVKGALKAREAGAAAIVVSNHGGRVLDQCAATAEVLADIVDAMKGSGVKIFVDGGIRTGVDVFKALALGADGVLICRPFVTAVYGGGAEGVKCYIDKLAGELADTMQMCGAHTLAEITPDMVRV